MGGFIDIASQVMTVSERRLETVSQNVSNVSTPGFKSQSSFISILNGARGVQSGAGSASTPASQQSISIDFSQGALSETGRQLDLAIAGTGFFKVATPQGLFLTRQGQFQLADDGRIQTAQGFVLQRAGGGDVVLSSSEIEIMGDGTVLEQGLPVAQIGLFAVDDVSKLKSEGGSLFRFDGETLSKAISAVLHQGMLEGANVSMADEMLEMMEAVRQAETGARLVQVYDSLMGQAISTFGQRG